MAGPNTLEFTDANFESEVLESKTPVLVDFWADWCMPCKALGPIIDDIAKTYAGKAKVGKMNTGNNNSVPVTYNIQYLPTVVIFKNGEIARQFTGLTSKKDIAEALDAAMG